MWFQNLTHTNQPTDFKLNWPKTPTCHVRLCSDKI